MEEAAELQNQLDELEQEKERIQREKRAAKEAKRIESGPGADDVDSDGVVDEAEADVFTKLNDINKKLSTAMDKLMEEDAVDQQPPAAESPAVKETSESAGLKDEFYAGS